LIQTQQIWEIIINVITIFEPYNSSLRALYDPFLSCNSLKTPKGKAKQVGKRVIIDSINSNVNVWVPHVELLLKTDQLFMSVIEHIVGDDVAYSPRGALTSNIKVANSS
jgi:hypothetical protein